MDKLSNLQAEQIILGSLFLDETLVCVVKESGLAPSDFYYSYNQVIFKTKRKIYSEGRVIYLITLMEELKNIGMLESCGGIRYITSLSRSVIATSNLSYNIKIVKDLALQRNISQRLVDVTDNIEVMTPNDILKSIEEIKELSFDSKNVEELYIDASTIKRDKEIRINIKTGFKKLDNNLGGSTYGTMTILTGEP